MKFTDVFLLPNLITLSRFLLSLFLFLNFTPNDFTSFTLVVLIAVIGLSDSLDGIVARRFNLVSKLGVILDPLTDRVVFIILLFWLSSSVPSALIYSVLIREFLVLLGSLYVLDAAIRIPFLNQLAVFVIIFYFYVAIEYLYNLIYKSG